jgi:hypothetical protein
MSLERRLHEGVDRLTAGVDPDVERHLHASLRSGRRRILVRRASAVVGALAVLALLAITVPRALEAFTEQGRPAGRPSPSAPSTAMESVAGTYTIIVDPGPAVVDELGLAGAWTFELRADGSMTIAPPPGVPVPVETYTFGISDGRLQTNAFVDDLCAEEGRTGHAIGVYGVELVGDDLVLDAQSDFCVARVAILDDTTLRAAE